jgi:hypothetical protein
MVWFRIIHKTCCSTLLQPGHHVAGCHDDDRFNGIGVVVGNRHFVPNYGYTIYEYREGNGVNELIDHDAS